MLTATARNDTADRIEQLGSRVRYARKRNGLTLRELGDKVGCSESLLSKIERNHVVPSLPVLWRIAEALGTTFGALFSDRSMEPVTTYNGGERPLLSIGTGGGKGPDVVLERMVPSSENRTIDANLHIIPPGGGSSGAYSHSGEEVGYVVSGYLELTVDGRVYLLASGGSFFFNSSLPHSYRNVGSGEARVVWMNSHKSRLR
jgi:transcriptional regulator with XRE-family HTH domain/quercetin dioxygenase-like cupin family protein